MAKQKKPDANVKNRAIEALDEQLTFLRFSAEGLIARIITILESDTNTDGKLVAMMYREMSRVQDKIIEVAAKMAPYQEPKLESIDTKIENEHRFVVFGAHRAETAEDWLQNCDNDKRLLDLKAKEVN